MNNSLIYSILQYKHSLTLGEILNVGILFYFPGNNIYNLLLVIQQEQMPYILTSINRFSTHISKPLKAELNRLLIYLLPVRI